MDEIHWDSGEIIDIRAGKYVCPDGTLSNSVYTTVGSLDISCCRDFIPEIGDQIDILSDIDGWIMRKRS